MYEFLISTSIVALAEMGDKTQLLALLLAARFRKPVPILDRKSTRLNSSHMSESRMPSSA